MYSFYEQIKKEVDLQDLVQYLHHPLEKLKLLQIKLEDYKGKPTYETKIEIEELIRETNKLENSVFPDLFDNYCKLSLEFRNQKVIKQVKDSQENIQDLTSKEILLNNVAKLIEYIEVLDDRFYTYFSFEFLVNSRIISNLGYQENYIDKKKESIVLKNQYVFSHEDARKISAEKLNIHKNKLISDPNVNILTDNKITEPQNNITLTTQIALKPVIVEAEEKFEEIFNKKSNIENSEIKINSDIQENRQNIDTVTSTENPGQSVFLFFFVIFLFACMFVTLPTKNGNEDLSFTQRPDTFNVDKNHYNNPQEDHINIIKDKEFNRPYKKITETMNKSIEWRDMATNNKTNNQLNYLELIKNGFSLEPYSIIKSSNQIVHQEPSDVAQTYTLNMFENKIELSITNIKKSECNYIQNKLISQYNLQINKTLVNHNNHETECGILNTVNISEK